MKDTIYRQDAIDALDCINGTEEVLRSLPSAQPEKRTEERTETHACDLISRSAAIDAVISLCDDCDSGYCGSCRVNDFVGEKNARKVLEALPSAQFKGTNKGIHEITESDKISYAIICDKFPSPHVYFNTYDEAEHWARFNQPNYRPFYIIKRSEHFEIVGEVR